MFDECSFIPNQLMYWPTCPTNGEYLCEFFDGELLDPDAILEAHPNWRDCSLLPTTSRESRVSKPSQQKQEDPLAKTGVVGAFCRAYSITAVIDTFLTDIYAPSVTEGRYDYIPGESSAGVVIYDDKFAYSHHATDPACGKLLNAFDLVRIHKFGDDDEKKSFSAMMDFAVKDERVSALLLQEKQAAAAAEFEDWTRALQRDRGGVLQNSLHNITLIMTGMPRNPSPSNSQMADAVAKIVDLEAEINRDIDALVDIKCDLVKTIKAVDDIDCQLLLEGRYLCYKSWEQIAVDMGFRVRHVYEVHNDALKKVEKILSAQ